MVFETFFQFCKCEIKNEYTIKTCKGYPYIYIYIYIIYMDLEEPKFLEYNVSFNTY